MEYIDTALETYFKVKNPYSYNNEEYKKAEKGEIIEFETNKEIFLPKEENMNYKSYKNIKITKRKDNRWQARFSINGERKYIYGNTQKECYENLKQVFEIKQIKLEKTVSFYEYWDWWYKNHKEPFYKEGTLKNYRSVFNNQIKPNFSDKNIKQITALEINNFLNKMPNTRMKEYTYQFLKECFKQAYKDKKVKFDISDDIKKYHHKRKEGTALSVEQRKIIIEKAKNTIYDIFIFYLFTGCRPKEALNVKVNDFEDGLLHIKGTKTASSDRWIPVFEPIKKLLEKYKNTKTETLFGISDTTLKRRVADFKKICEFDFKTKDLRTTFATMCAEKGIAPRIIAKWLGHTTTQTTNKYYIKVLDNFEKEQIKLLDTTFDPTKEV